MSVRIRPCPFCGGPAEQYTPLTNAYRCAADPCGQNSGWRGREQWNRRQPDPKDAREALAALCHDQWSGWIKYLFGKVEGRTISEWAWARWQRQAFTPYAALTTAEKDSDRAEADRFIALLSK